MGGGHFPRRHRLLTTSDVGRLKAGGPLLHVLVARIVSGPHYGERIYDTRNLAGGGGVLTITTRKKPASWNSSFIVLPVALARYNGRNLIEGLDTQLSLDSPIPFN